MHRRPDPCDPRRLDLFLRQRLPAVSEREVETHVQTCPICRHKLDELAGGARWWTEVRRYLADDGAAELLRTADSSGTAAGAPRLDFLEPSPNPASLGRLGEYEVLEVLGSGGMGLVLKAFDAALHRPVAIKVLAAELAANGAARKRFVREAQAAAAVSHEHVVPVHAVHAAAVPPYLVMAFIAGQSLQERLDRDGPLELKEILRIGTQTAKGLAAAHAQGLVHRDIKPANIMLENGIERVRITDFGLARAVDDASVTIAGAVAGTPQYMAPEQARGDAVDQRADLFSLGSTLYSACTGRPPFRADGSMAVLRHVVEVEPAPIRSINPDLPAWVEGVVRKLMAKDPADRFASAVEVADLLERCLAHVQQPDRNELPTVARQLGGRTRQSRRTRSGWLAAVLGVAAVVVITVTVSWWPFGPHPRPPFGPDDSTTINVPTDEYFNAQADRFRARISALRDAVSATTPAGDGASNQARQASSRLLAARHRIAESEAGTDPTVDRLTSLRERLRAIRRSLEHLTD